MDERYTVTMTELRRSEAWDRFALTFAEDPEAVFTVTRYGKPVFCIMSPEYYERLMATSKMMGELTDGIRTAGEQVST